MQNRFLRRLHSLWGEPNIALLPVNETPLPGVPLITLRQLTKTFSEGGQTRTVLDELDLTVDAGAFVVLLGHSGSGKSTLLNLISGIETPSSGAVEIGGVNITALPDHQRTLFRRDRIGFVFQFFNLIPTLTVLENVTLPQELAGMEKTAVSTHALHLLHRVGLADRAQAFPDKLSGGEQQRVAIARAVVTQPDIIIADEPTGNVDPEMGARLMRLFIELNKRRGTTVIIATHDLGLVRQVNAPVFRLTNGLLVEDVEFGGSGSGRRRTDPAQLAEGE